MRLLQIAFLLFASHAQAEVWDKVSKAIQSAHIVVLGETHDQPRLAEVARELVRRQNDVDCLFVELSQDLQPALDRYVENGDELALARAIYGFQRPLIIQALRDVFSFDPEAAKKRILGLPERLNEETSLNLLNISVLQPRIAMWARTSNARLIAYDVSRDSEQTPIANRLQIMGSALPFRFNQVEQQQIYYQMLQKRNEQMAQNIANQFRSGACRRALVIVGMDHEIDRQAAATRTRGEFKTYQPLSQELNRRSLNTKTVLVGWSMLEEPTDGSPLWNPRDPARSLSRHSLGAIRFPGMP